MKIACIGNMNNNLFCVTRYLRDQGFDAELLLLNTELNDFHPAADSYTDEFRTYTRRLDWGTVGSFGLTGRRDIDDDLRGYDFVIGCGAAPAFMHAIGRTLDIFAPYGSDIYELPVFRFRSYNNQSWLRPAWLKNQAYGFMFAKAQRQGIRRARSVVLGDPAVRNFATKILPGRKFPKCVLPVVYAPIYNSEFIGKYTKMSSIYPLIKEIRDRHDLVVFHHSRHIWRSSPDPYSWKGNDKLVRGFAEFVKQAKGANPCLVMCEYGPDVSATKALVEDLGVGGRVYWMRKLRRKDIMLCLDLADVGIGELAMPWFISGTILENLVLGKPMLNYWDNQPYTEICPELYPMIPIKTDDDIANALLSFLEHPDEFRSQADTGRAWYQRYIVDPSLDEILRIMGTNKGVGAGC